ncbi:TPA: MerR family transcriptional regulator [Kluyvera cryocrescens]
MFRISEVAAIVGLSRTALLYYEKLGIIKSTRLPNGYRTYSEKDVQRLQLVIHLHAAGLTLKECLVCINVKSDKRLLTARLKQLEDDIALKLRAKTLLESMLGVSEERTWHQELEKISPDVHLQWLNTQGINEKEALRIRNLSRNIHGHDSYMSDFNEIFLDLIRLGPGSETDTLKALSMVPDKPENILEIGCGRGIATRILASNTQASITALDNEPRYLNALYDLRHRVNLCCASMTALPFTCSIFDLIWAEGSAYIMGFNNALLSWKRYLRDGGYLVISEIVWLSNTPSERARNFWSKNYPAMLSVAQNQMLIKKAGYDLISSFEMSKEAWELYLVPLSKRVELLKRKLNHSMAWQDLKSELDIHDACLGEYGYQFFIIQKRQ